VGPDDECVIHTAKPAEGLLGWPLQSYFFKVLFQEVGGDSGYWPTHGHTVSLLIELSIKPEKEEDLPVLTSFPTDKVEALKHL
jgi:hypothetical protein